eukprot:972268-Pyramimonas_sp.AAC.1
MKPTIKTKQRSAKYTENFSHQTPLCGLARKAPTSPETAAPSPAAVTQRQAPRGKKLAWRRTQPYAVVNTANMNIVFGGATPG